MLFYTSATSESQILHPETLCGLAALPVGLCIYKPMNGLWEYKNVVLQLTAYIPATVISVFDREKLLCEGQEALVNWAALWYGNVLPPKGIIFLVGSKKIRWWLEYL